MPKYKFTEIAYNSTEKKKPTEADKATYIGLEHLDTGTLTISRWGSDVAPIGEKLIMKKGDVLFGKRRAYQKKVGIAPFDGIFSAHGMVLRPNEKVVTKEYFPLFISSDYFLDEAIRISVGSLSPTVNWKDLKELEFSIPTLEVQKRITPLIWAAIRAKNAYKSLISGIDSLVKSQFIEMFADTPKGKIQDLCKIIMGQSPDGKTYNTEEEGVPFYQGKTEFGDLYIGKPVTWTTSPTRIAEANDVLMSVRAPVGSTNIATQKCCLGRGLAALKAIPGKSNSMFILYSMRSIERDIENMGVGSTFKAINKEQVHQLPIPLADLTQQAQFVALAEQSDKSKFELQEAIKKVDNLIKSLITQE